MGGWNDGIWVSNGQYRRAQDNWWVLAGENFATSQGDDNPLEDFATSFAAYFMFTAGRRHAGVDRAALIAAKVDYVGDFTSRLA